jgi:hypothetical protein
MSAPLHPSYSMLQSRIYCFEMGSNSWDFIAWVDSRAAAAANAQQDPHYP